MQKVDDRMLKRKILNELDVWYNNPNKKSTAAERCSASGKDNNGS